MTTEHSTFLQMTDLHIKRPGALAYGKVDTASYLRRAIARVRALDVELAPAAVVMTGDLVDSGGLDEYRQLKGLLDDLPCPYHLMVGNHDARETLREVFHDVPTLFSGGAFVQYAVDIGAVRFIALDSLDVGQSGGTLCEERLDWLAQALDAAKDRPVVIGLHHPPFQCGIGHMDVAALDARSTAALAAIVSAHPNVERVIAGHVHREIHVRFAGTMASVAGSVAHQVCLDLRDDAPSAFTMEPPSFAVHRWTPAHGLVSHLAYVDEAPGPFPFYDAAGALID